MLIGLTGGIGSGKSVVAQFFADLGIVIIDADKIARNLVTSNSPVFNQIVDYFGPSILDAHGVLDRAQLRSLVFSDQQKRLWLEALLHPLILDEMLQQAQQAQSAYCILVIPLLIEKNIQDKVDRILLVDVQPEVQKQRVQQRDQLDPLQLDAILQAQLSREQRLQHADDIINNDQDLVHLKQQVLQLHEKYLQYAHSKNN